MGSILAIGDRINITIKKLTADSYLFSSSFL